MEPKVFSRRFFDKIHSKIATTSRIETEVSLKIIIIMKNQLQISGKMLLKLKCCVDILWDINPNMWLKSQFLKYEPKKQCQISNTTLRAGYTLTHDVKNLKLNLSNVI